ncbi:MAG: Hsp20/alpha crystallin family protein [Gammaproteobacteria bacterium]|nr:Hsp20/alpha crystallin family protein [Gammaproteobacteria bacterium]
MQPVSIDVLDRENDLCVRAELPGYRKEDIDVSLLNNTITIKANMSKEDESSEGDYHRREIFRGYVSRTEGLPADVEVDQAKAELKDGVLEVIIPKSKRSPRQQVEISG